MTSIRAILDRYQLKEEEHVMSMKVCHLNVRNEQGKVVQEPFIVLGTAHVRGEDHQVMGNIYIMDVLRPPSDVAASRLDIVASSDQRGAVSSVAPVEGILVACIGMKAPRRHPSFYKLTSSPLVLNRFRSSSSILRIARN